MVNIFLLASIIFVIIITCFMFVREYFNQNRLYKMCNRYSVVYDNRKKRILRTLKAIKYCLAFSLSFIVVIALIEIKLLMPFLVLTTLVLFQIQREKWRGCFDE